MTDEELMKATGKISHEEAKEIVSRLFTSHFKGPNGAQISIPANPAWDDDLRMSSYILQCERLGMSSQKLSDDEYQQRLQKISDLFGDPP